MSSEQDDQEVELVEHQQVNRGAGLQSYESNVSLSIDQKNAWGETAILHGHGSYYSNDVTG